MFGNKKDGSLDPALEQVGTIIGPGAVVDGPISTKDSARIDGTVNGNATITGSLIVGQDGKVGGTVSAVNAYIAGEVNGNVSAPQGKVEISDTGKVYGDITCKTIIIDENALFQGKCDMTSAEKSPADVAKERISGSDSNSGEEKSESEENKSEDNKEENQ